ncbi:hypothetical protein FOZ60_008224 [Perkinsus olseni]|uniref:Uncharacterized protein n=1 Tax=Perkinsus olseni TaxID=32597 RepID=A0A7J6PDU3_PEROL|nr:hypothetical protein FOZ60_008224 [Perkinsus olseni]
MLPKEGLILDFGVATGNFTRYIAGELKGRRMYGFDSFKGLPSDWLPAGGVLPKAAMGAFAQDKIPEMPDNVELVVGLFDDTLPAFAEDHPDDTIALLHIDCDIPRHNPQYAEHELKAFFEFLVARGKDMGEDCQFEWIGTGDVSTEECLANPKYKRCESEDEMRCKDDEGVTTTLI